MPNGPRAGACCSTARPAPGWEEITGKPFPAKCWTIEDASLKALVRSDGFQDIRTVEVFGSFDLRVRLEDFEGRKLRREVPDPEGGRVDQCRRAPGAGSGARIPVGGRWQRGCGVGSAARCRLPVFPDCARAADPAQDRGVQSFAPGGEGASRGALAQRRQGCGVRNRSRRRSRNSFAAISPTGSAANARLVERSPISLQNHSSETWFRNIKIRGL